MERYRSLFFEEINFAPIQHSWKIWEPKHQRVFRAKLQNSLYPFRPSPLPLTPAQSQPNFSLFLSPIQVWIEAQVSPTWPKKHQALFIFFAFFFSSHLLCPAIVSLPFPRLHQLLFRATPFSHAFVCYANLATRPAAPTVFSPARHNQRHSNSAHATLLSLAQAWPSCTKSPCYSCYLPMTHSSKWPRESSLAWL